MIVSGQKTFEVRLNDFECSKGDILVWKEWDPDIKEYTGRFIEKKIIYVSNTKNQIKHWSKQEIEEKGLLIIFLWGTMKKEI